ncbi:rhamnulokinase family protein [Corynebacterium sp. NPDC060344]|uniref:rhamnulokinase n=1 Tax=Corynebacterium sp. NPDC060344 TaxID=3347101 RepID=UPI00365FAD85
MTTRQHAAIALDLGSSNGRAVLGTLSGGVLRLQEAHRFAHKVDTTDGVLTWDTDRLRDGALAGISVARTLVPIDVESIGIDTWGVDYALLDDDGDLVRPVRAYRDGRMAEHFADYNKALDPWTAWCHTGVQPAEINTSVQLFSDLAQEPDLVDRVDRVQLLPDYFAWLLCGEKGFGRAIASTTGLAAPGTRRWSSEVLDSLGIPEKWFGQIAPDSMVLAPEKTSGIPLVRPGGHDTACAVHAMPVPEDVKSSVFISCGSWTLVGAVTDEPILSRGAYRAGFTNETCVDGRNRFLRNITGMWILQDLMRGWCSEGTGMELLDLLDAAKQAPSMGLVFDPNDAAFTGTGNMEQRINERMQAMYGRTPDGRGQLARLIFESLAIAHARTIKEIESLTGTPAEVINMVGGGSRNGLLCQMTASATGVPLLSGPAEASAAGNLLSQFEAIGAIGHGERIGIIERSFTPLRFEPRDPTRWDDMTRRLEEAEKGR